MNDHVTLMIIIEEFYNNKTHFLCCFLTLEDILTPLLGYKFVEEARRDNGSSQFDG